MLKIVLKTSFKSLLMKNNKNYTVRKMQNLWCRYKMWCRHKMTPYFLHVICNPGASLWCFMNQ